MDILTKQKFTNLLIIALVVINIASLSFIWYRQLQAPPKPPAPPPPAKVKVDIFFENELNLSAYQQKQFAGIRKEHAERTWRMNHRMRELRGEIIHESFSSKPDTEKIAALADTIAAIQKNYEEFLSAHFRRLMAVCTPEQKVILKNIFVSSLAPPEEPPPPPRNKAGDRPPPPPPRRQ